MGLTVEVPAGWSPASLSGEGAQGYLKVISPDTRYLEIKWEKPRGAVSVPDALERYFQRLRRTARRARVELHLRERPRGLKDVRPPDQAPITYSWESTQKAIGCIWHCSGCGRLVIAELVGAPADDLSAAAQLLGSIRDHAEDGWNTWALFGLVVPVPEAFRVERQSLMTGHQRLVLRHAGSQVQADRWGLAEIALRGVDAWTWYASRERASLLRYAYHVQNVDVHGHPGFAVRGRVRLHVALFKLLRFPMTLTWPRFFLHGRVWHCPEANRIHAVMAEVPRRSTLVEECVARACCHPRERQP